jgi:siroheme decarboxylase
MNNLSNQEEKAARLIQGDIPLVSNPFADIADACSLSTIQVISMSQRLLGNGTMRKIGAILRHQKAGYRKNALVMWSVPPDAIESTGRLFASLSFISHCYERKPAFQNKYNLFTMLHAQDDDISPLVNTMAQSINSNDFLILESLQEYKKTSPEYF